MLLLSRFSTAFLLSTLESSTLIRTTWLGGELSPHSCVITRLTFQFLLLSGDHPAKGFLVFFLHAEAIYDLSAHSSFQDGRT
jgi:hypothetical protein